ncbi:MAG TPA: AGE family epimerase/isomerase, partial [Stellaceae bacterium]|nr:AGE family epimerase/isomerase [Stellaceae bacterium]
MTPAPPPADRRLRTALDRLRRWLLDDAYPIWATTGLEKGGGFQEKIGLDGVPTRDNRRARVQARQVYCYAQAPSFGWTRDAEAPAAQGLAWFLKH